MSDRHISDRFPPSPEKAATPALCELCKIYPASGPHITLCSSCINIFREPVLEFADSP
jgi:hypothetical protein